MTFLDYFHPDFKINYVAEHSQNIHPKISIMLCMSSRNLNLATLASLSSFTEHILPLRQSSLAGKTDFQGGVLHLLVSALPPCPVAGPRLRRRHFSDDVVRPYCAALELLESELVCIMIWFACATPTLPSRQQLSLKLFSLSFVLASELQSPL